jgi:hypothetical protein
LTQKNEGSLRSQASGEVVELRERLRSTLSGWSTGAALAVEAGLADAVLADAVLAVVTPELERRDAEMAQAVEDWGRNDEQTLAENQRLADENELLREELHKVSGGWEARVASRAALRAQLDRAVFVWPQDAMVRIRECIADPNRMLPRYHQSAGEPYETVAGWGARAVIKLMESWRADPSRDSAPSEASMEDAVLFAVAQDRVRRDKGERHSLEDVARELELLDEGRPSSSSPPAAGEADTTPRVWRRGDPEPPLGVDLLEDSLGDRVKRVPHGWQWCRIYGRDCNSFGGYRWEELWSEGGEGDLVEVLPNTEQEAEK